MGRFPFDLFEKINRTEKEGNIFQAMVKDITNKISFYYITERMINRSNLEKLFSITGKTIEKGCGHNHDYGDTCRLQFVADWR